VARQEPDAAHTIRAQLSTATFPPVTMTPTRLPANTPRVTAQGGENGRG
jgi:hypothetical protein